MDVCLEVGITAGDGLLRVLLRPDYQPPEVNITRVIIMASYHGNKIAFCKEDQRFEFFVSLRCGVR